MSDGGIGNIQVQGEKLLLIQDSLGWEKVKGLAAEHKSKAFGLISNFLFKPKESEISIMEKKYKAINIGVSALRSAKSIIGYDEKKAIFDQSMDYIKEDMANKLAEMDKIIDMANPLINQMDLKEAVNTEEANKLLAQFSSNEFEKIISNLQAKPVAPVLLDNNSNGKASEKENAYANILEA